MNSIAAHERSHERCSDDPRAHAADKHQNSVSRAAEGGHPVIQGWKHAFKDADPLRGAVAAHAHRVEKQHFGQSA
jgi:hypothetical protein